jgi:hypothetical protein
VVGLSIDFFPVGTGAKNGDAIVLEYGTDLGKSLMVVDGGSLTTGQELIDHIQNVLGGYKTIEHVVCTHQDADHASGLRKIIESFDVKNLWVHQPWLYAEELVPAFKHRWSADGLRKHLRNDCFPIVASLCDLAEAYLVPLREPFQGATIGPFRVLAPSISRYFELVPQMNQTPAQKVTASDSVLNSIFKVVVEAVANTGENWGFETLRTPAPGATSVTNETSVVMLGQFDGARVLLTGDAGVGALEDAIAGAALYQIPLLSPDLVQVPHHGSRRNVSPAVLDSILGERHSSAGIHRGSAISLVSTGATEFPRRVVENAFTRRGYGCFSTKSGWKNYTIGLAPRWGLSPDTPAALHSTVED